mmetsp:Transcript_27891/g.45773  ORF Transcript_27891/g.45773 Transcript_27891/m.45773 type:complete len:89 (+) Transcript_27891:129-395(+)
MSTIRERPTDVKKNAGINADLSKLITCLEGELHDEAASSNYDANKDDVVVEEASPKNPKKSSMRRLWKRSDSSKRRSKYPSTVTYGKE